MHNLFSLVNCYFNPPTPHGVGHCCFCHYHHSLSLISIHPPRMGWDIDWFANLPGRIWNFNPPTPHGVGLPSALEELYQTRFQSTHPAWGGTWGRLIGNGNIPDFNPPTPHGVGLCSHPYSRIKISISIHPPRMGWDNQPFCFALMLYNFNPPTPHGVGLSTF